MFDVRKPKDGSFKCPLTGITLRPNCSDASIKVVWRDGNPEMHMYGMHIEGAATFAGLALAASSLMAEAALKIQTDSTKPDDTELFF